MFIIRKQEFWVFINVIYYYYCIHRSEALLIFSQSFCLLWLCFIFLLKWYCRGKKIKSCFIFYFCIIIKLFIKAVCVSSKQYDNVSIT